MINYKKPKKRRRLRTDSLLSSPKSRKFSSNPLFQDVDEHEILPKSLAVDTSKPTAQISSSSLGRHYTTSVAIPSSIVANAQNFELKSRLAGHIARALAVYCVDEVVVYQDHQDAQTLHPHTVSEDTKFLSRVLSYLECPPYLRKALFGMHPHLRSAGVLPSLDLPAHQSVDVPVVGAFREGIVSGWIPFVNQMGVQEKYAGAEQKGNKQGSGRNQIGLLNVGTVSGEPATLLVEEPTGICLVDVGISSRPAGILCYSTPIPRSTRLTLQVICIEGVHAAFLAKVSSPSSRNLMARKVQEGMICAVPVAASEPRQKCAIYWGYRVRVATDLSSVMASCPFTPTGVGYDMIVATSERGKSIDEMKRGLLVGQKRFKNLLILFGGLAGIESAVRSDTDLLELLKHPSTATKKQKLTAKNARRRSAPPDEISDSFCRLRSALEVEDLFDYWINVCPNQGSKTIRTEEALWITLAELRSWIRVNGYEDH